MSGSGVGEIVHGDCRELGADRAAQELRLKRNEFVLAVELGHVRTAREGSAGRRRVARREIARLKAAEGFPHVLRERVRMVGTAQAARMMGISPGRFTRLARAGLVTPVRFFLNRYRAVVWLYLADELRAFAAAEPLLLTGRLPEPLRMLADREDRRPRNWRGRRVAALLREAHGPWERAAATAAPLDPVELARLVRDPHELAALNRLKPALAPSRPDSEAAGAIVRALVTADAADEVAWYLADVEALLAEAGRTRADTGGEEADEVAGCPSPAEAEAEAEGAEAGRTAPPGRPVPRGGRSGLLTRLRIRRRRPAALPPVAGRRPHVPGPR